MGHDLFSQKLAAARRKMATFCPSQLFKSTTRLPMTLLLLLFGATSRVSQESVRSLTAPTRSL